MILEVIQQGVLAVSVNTVIFVARTMVLRQLVKKLAVTASQIPCKNAIPESTQSAASAAKKSPATPASSIRQPQPQYATNNAVTRSEQPEKSVMSGTIVRDAGAVCWWHQVTSVQLS